MNPEGGDINQHLINKLHHSNLSIVVPSVSPFSGTLKKNNVF